MMEPLLYLASGFLMKLADDLADETTAKIAGASAGILCGFSVGLLVTISSDAPYIFFGIFIGTLLAGKIDNLNHFLAGALFLLVALLGGLPVLEPVTLIVCVLGAFIDEVGHDLCKDKGYLSRIFEYRLILKMGILVLAIIPHFISWIHGIGWYSLIFFLLFELSYEFTGWFDKHLIGYL
ncbi:hypothetical protein [Methanothermobacter tenebrarum]|nr:hypothetical protein [Methanothermobacter tenebrarum]NPV64316.1 hypothetical protein [Methanobacteriaceae archaeon]